MIPDVKDKVQQIICSIVQNDDYYGKITDETNLIDDIGMDSILIMQLVVEIEITFDIELNDDDLLIDNLSNMNQLIQLIVKQLAIKA